MMNTKYTYNAVFEAGRFQILSPQKIDLPEGQTVRLIVELIESPEDILELATRVYEGFSEEDIEELETMVLERDNFFKGREQK